MVAGAYRSSGRLLNSLISLFLVSLAATVWADMSPVKTGSQQNRTQTSALVESPPPKQGLNFAVGERGLTSLSFNGQSLLASSENGELQPQKSVIRAMLDALLPRPSSGVAIGKKQPNTIDLTYRWGRISCAYGKQDNVITMKIEVSNTGSEPLNGFSLRLMELIFPSIPRGGPLEAGMFGFAFKGPEWLLDQCPPTVPTPADPRFVLPIV